MKRSKGRRKRLKCKVDLEKAVKLVKQHPASQQLADVVRALLWLGAPKLFCQLVWIIGARCTDDETLGKLDVIELFAGKRAICRAAVERGLRALPCEIDDDKIYMDMVGPQGLTREALMGAPVLQALDSQNCSSQLAQRIPWCTREATPECPTICVVPKVCFMFANRALARPAPPMGTIHGEQGFLFAIFAVLCLLRDLGLGTMAPVCSSWVWLNRSTSGRSIRSPLGT